MFVIVILIAEEEEVTKRSIRVQCWKKFQQTKSASNDNFIFNRITNFNGAQQAANLLAETPEFKNASEYYVDEIQKYEVVRIRQF